MYREEDIERRARNEAFKLEIERANEINFELAVAMHRAMLEENARRLREGKPTETQKAPRNFATSWR